MMRSRLDGVAARDRESLEALAVGGREVDLDVLLDVLDLDEETVLDGLERLLASGIVRERRAGELIFYAVSHRKFADVVYRDLHPARRARLHRRMAYAYGRTASAVFNTSFTTAMAFVSTAISPIMTISAFGAFAAIAILVNYVMVITWLPAIILTAELLNSC